MAFLEQPFRWLKAITHYRATTSGGPNFPMSCVFAKITEDELATLDLTSWELGLQRGRASAFSNYEPICGRFSASGLQCQGFYSLLWPGGSDFAGLRLRKGSRETWTLDLDTDALGPHQVRIRLERLASPGW